MERFVFEENGLFMTMEVSGAGEVRLMHLGLTPDAPGQVPKAQKGAYRMLQLQNAGENQDGPHGLSHLYTQPGTLLRYLSHQDVRTPQGRKLMISQSHQDLYVTSYFQFYNGIPALRCWTVIRNNGTRPRTLQHVSSFALTGLDRGDFTTDRLSLATGGIGSELRFQTRTLGDLGLPKREDPQSARLARSGCGTWTSGENLPMAVYENDEQALAWQIEHNGSWLYELAQIEGRLSLQLSGPTFQEGHWQRPLMPGESFTSVPVAVALGGDQDAALAALTAYRRRIQHPSEDSIKKPLVYNDRQALEGGPGLPGELPLIEAAARMGCEIYCIDAGWFAAGPWWGGVGEWIPSPARFPGGLNEVVSAIRQHGMLPGLWLEIEAMGIDCPLAEGLPKSWFFQNAGQPVIDQGRYQLDFRNPEVVSHADRVIDRLVAQEGICYLKMDYNIQAGPGTQLEAPSAGDGLLEHNRAYLAWLDRVFARYPWLTIENSAAGGQRMDYALLSRHSLQNLSEQSDPRLLAPMAAAAPAALLPEQALLRCPLRPDMDTNQAAWALLGGLLGRMSLQGPLTELSSEIQALAQEAAALYKQLREDLRPAVPFWPLGLPQPGDGWLALGMRREGHAWLALWRVEGKEASAALALPFLKGRQVSAKVRFPAFAAAEEAQWDAGEGTLRLTLEAAYTARCIELTWE